MRAVPFSRYQERDSRRPGLLDRMSVQPLAAYSLGRRLKHIAQYGFQVRRASDNALKDIGFLSNGKINESEIYGHCSGTDGFLNIIYDQSGNGLGMTAPSSGTSTKVFDSSTGLLKFSQGAPYMDFDGSDDQLPRSDAFGLSGSPALTVGCVVQMDAVSGSPVVWNFGGGGNHESFGMLFNGTDADNIYAWQNSSYREFAVDSSVTAAPSRWVFSKALNGTPDAHVVRQNGVSLSESGLANTAMNMTDTAARLGCYVGDSLFANYKMSFWALWNADLGANDLGLLDVEMGLHQ